MIQANDCKFFRMIQPLAQLLCFPAYWSPSFPNLSSVLSSLLHMSSLPSLPSSSRFGHSFLILRSTTTTKTKTTTIILGTFRRENSNLLEYKVRLPCTIHPVSLLAARGIKSTDLITEVVRIFFLQDPHARSLVLGPTAESPGRVISSREAVSLGHSNSGGNANNSNSNNNNSMNNSGMGGTGGSYYSSNSGEEDTILELWVSPQTIGIATLNGSGNYI